MTTRRQQVAQSDHITDAAKASVWPEWWPHRGSTKSIGRLLSLFSFSLPFTHYKHNDTTHSHLAHVHTHSRARARRRARARYSGGCGKTETVGADHPTFDRSLTENST